MGINYTHAGPFLCFMPDSSISDITSSVMAALHLVVMWSVLLSLISNLIWCMQMLFQTFFSLYLETWHSQQLHIRTDDTEFYWIPCQLSGLATPYAQCHTFVTIGSHSTDVKTTSDSINHCSSDYFKSSNTEVKFNQL